MSLSATTTKISYPGPGGTVFTFPYPVQAAGDIEVYRTDLTTGDITGSVLVLNTDYTLAGVGGASCTVTLTADLGSFGLFIRRVVDITQDVVLENGGVYYPKIHERQFDKLTMIDQQQEEQLGRSLHLPESLSGVSTALPLPVAGAALAWNATEDGLGNLLGESAGTLEDAKALTLAALASTGDPALGDALVGVKQPFSGAAARTQHSKNQDVLTTSDFPDLATAISSIGSTKATLIVNSNVTVSADLTIPSNVSLEVVGGGLITVASGVRLFINGPFAAPRLQQAFSASLHTCTFTANVNGNSLIVTSVASGTLALGHVLNGVSGAPAGTVLEGTGTGTGGTGNYYLNNYLDLVTSQTMTTTGPSVIFAPGTVDAVIPQWFGAIADDGTTDNSAAFQQAVYSIKWGGVVKIPAGKYKVNSPTVLHGGLTIEGEGQADSAFGSPPNNAAVPSYVWLGGSNTSIFIIGSTQSQVHLRNMALGSASTSSATPPGLGKIGIQYEGRFPGYIWSGSVDRCWFFNLDIAIKVNDSWAGNTTYRQDPLNNPGVTSTYYDWAVNPISITNTTFHYPGICVQFNSTNSDAWKFDNCVLFVPSGGDGIKIIRCGFLKMDNCFGGGASVSNNRFLSIVGAGANPVDAIVLDNVQVESCTHFIKIDPTSSFTAPQSITLRNCITQMGADIYLGKMCDFYSYNCQYMATVYVDAAGVTVNSYGDNFASTYHLSKLSGDATWLRNYVPGVSPDSNYPVPFIWLAGKATVTGTAAPASGAWNAGDRCVRQPPVVGQPVAWSCTVAGTPGTWVSEGNL